MVNGGSSKTKKSAKVTESDPHAVRHGGGMASTKQASGQASPVRQSPRKASSSSRTGLLPTPLSQSPSRPSPTSTNTTLNYPPSFDAASLHHTSSRYSAQQYTPFSPYRQSEYGRSGGLVVNGSNGPRGSSARTKVERRLFDEDGGGDDSGEDGPGGKGRNRGSSPLAAPFQAKMILRKGPVDLIHWLRKNFHHVPAASNAPIPSSSMSLLGVRTLLSERFPRVPEMAELAKAVEAAFPHVKLDYPGSASGESPMMSGLVWHGVDLAEDERNPALYTPDQSTIARRGAAGTNGDVALEMSAAISHSPSNTSLVSPTSGSAKQRLPTTPARSVLDEFAELATKSGKTAGPKTRSLPGEITAPAPAYALAHICNSSNETPAFKIANGGKKRARSKSPGTTRRRAVTPDRLSSNKLTDLLAAAEAVEGSPITKVIGLGHKRRRTIGGTGGMKDVMEYPRRNRQQGRESASPFIRSRGMTLPGVKEDAHSASDVEDSADPADTSADMAFVDRSHTDSTASQQSLSAVSTALQPAAGSSRQFINHVGHPPGCSTPGDMSNTSQPATPFPPPTRLAPRQRKANELPTEGDNPGVDCKPPYPYHELIRHAIEHAPEGRLQLSQIYASIAERFPFFKTLDEKKTSGWQNSIRHNLSLKKMFVRVNKVDGVPDEAGKGGWWTVQAGVPDEGRPGRKARAKRRAGQSGEGEGSGDVSVEGMSVDEEQSELNGDGGGGGGEGSLPVYPASAYDGQAGSMSHYPMLPPPETDGQLPNGPGPNDLAGGPPAYENGFGHEQGLFASMGSMPMTSADEGREKAERWVTWEDGLGQGVQAPGVIGHLEPAFMAVPESRS